MEEIAALARARGITLAEEVVRDSLAFLDRLPPGTTSSMQRDMAAGRPSELEDLCGAVVRMGREAGIATPANAHLYAVLLPQETRARAAAAEGVATPPPTPTPGP